MGFEPTQAAGIPDSLILTVLSSMLDDSVSHPFGLFGYAFVFSCLRYP